MKPLRLLALALAASAFAGGVAAPAPAAANAPAYTTARCANADVHPTTVSRRAVRTATLCLINAERRRHRMSRLRHNGRLARAAVAHARDMVRNDYFAHDAPDGTDFVDRILDTDYVSQRTGGWLLGENLAWGSGSLATPRQIMRAWMQSPGHRANILRRQYREIGIGVVLGAPVAGRQNAATYATEFGRRR